MKKKFNLDLTTQNKLIITALVISTALILLIAFWAVNRIKIELDKSYSSFGQLLTKTLAVQNYEMAKLATTGESKNFFKAHINSILSSTNDISYITFKNKSGKIIYTTIESFNKRAQKADTNISSPLIDQYGHVIGAVEVGLSADLAKNVTRTTKNSIFTIFGTIWVVFTLVILGNAFLIRRELTLLHNGVKEIEQGKFGTLLNYNQASGEIKELFDAFNDMSKKLHSYEEQNIDQLTLERNKLEAVLMNIANGVVVCDNYDKITIINSAAQKILNGTSEELINTSIQKYCDSTGELCFRSEIAAFKDTPLEIIEKKPLEFNINIDKRVIKSVISPMYSKMHDYLGYIIILIDITKEAEADRLKDDFISNVSHELRTPVTILTSYADTLYNYGEQFNFDEQKEFIGTINEEVIRLNKMVNDILDFSRLQSNKDVEKEYQDITLTVDKIVNSHKVLADEKSISVTVIKEENLPFVAYNTQSIERVISNLITNAIKYSPNNSRIKVRTEIARDPNYLEVSIEDNGIGIAPEHQKMIFERFYRIENQVHTIKGTGLGLHLVKVAIEDRHQGKVFVRSKLNEGSTFGFWLPLEQADITQKPLPIEKIQETEQTKEIEPETANETNVKQETSQNEEVIEDESIDTETQEEKQEIAEETKEVKEENTDNLVEPVYIADENENNNMTNPLVSLEPEEQQAPQEEEEWEITFEVRDN